MHKYKLFFDGSQKKCTIGYGIVIYKDDTIIYKEGGFHEDAALSNNVGEYIGLIIGLTKALELGITDVEVFGDSKLVIGQMNQEFRTKASTMKPCYCVAKLLQDKFKKISFTWIPRKANKEADRESR